MTLQLVAQHLGRDLSALGRYERAEWPIQRGDVVALLDLYGVHHAEQRAALLDVAERVWHLHRWDIDHRDPVDAAFISVDWLAFRAGTICCWDPLLVPTLLQTRQYHQQVITCRLSAHTTTKESARAVERRMQRHQSFLHHSAGRTVQAVIDEAALRRQVGDAGLMRAQLEHLSQLARQPHVTIRVLPTRVALHAGLDAAFLLFTMDPYPPVAHLDTAAGQLVVEAPVSARYANTFQQLCQAALSPRESTELITTLAGGPTAPTSTPASSAGKQ